MATWNYDDFEDRPEGGSMTATINWLGAAMSLLLIAGLATWGWKLMVRDVTGIPVVRALEGPMRVAPGDPGGEAAAYQGLAVNNIAAEAPDAGRVETVSLAPSTGTLSDEDRPMGELAALQEDAVEVVPAPVFGSEMSQADAIEPVRQPSATDLAVAAALAGIDDVALVPASLGLEGGAPATSPRPLQRPSEPRVASIVPIQDDVTGELIAATVAPGTRLVQLGAYGSLETAQIEWANALSLFGDYMVGKERVIQKAETGGKEFFRLRAHGFEDLADARRFCSVLVAEGANCIPVVQQ